MSDSRFQRRPAASPVNPATSPASTPAVQPAPMTAEAKLDGKGKPMSKALEAYIARHDELDQIDIRMTARALRCVENQDNDPTKWKMPNGSNFWFKPNTQGWKDLNNDTGGQGSVKLVRVLKEFATAKEAMGWLSEHFTEDGKIRPGVQVDASVFAPREEKQFRAAGNYERYISEVMEYLSGERGIPPSLLRQEIKAGRLYATRRDVSRDRGALEQHNDRLSQAEADALAKGESVPDSAGVPIDAPVVDASSPANRGKPQYNRDSEDWKTHCAFISRTAGELRCVEKSGFKGTMPGSQSDEDVTYTVPHQKPIAERLLAMVEAAVDCQSYSALFPGRITSSTNGAYRFSLHFKLALQALTWPGFGVRLGFDSDEAGDLAAQRVFNAFYASKAIAHRYKLDVQDVEEWFISGHLKVDPDASPHTLFFGNGQGFASGLPVHVKEIDRWTDEAGKPHIKKRWVITEKTTEPTVIVRVNMPVGPFEKAGETLNFKVTAQSYAYVVNELDVRRDRPTHAKDWNEELLRLGSAYVRDYERCAEEGFTRAPKLPPDMEAMRDRSPMVIEAKAAIARPAPAAPSPAPASSVPEVSGPAPSRFQQRQKAVASSPNPPSSPQADGPARRFRRP